MRVLNLSNKAFREKEQASLGSRTQSDLLEGEPDGRLTGLLTESGILGMFVDADFDNVDTVSIVLQRL